MVSPLAGVRVLEFSQVASGPMAGRMLAELGASVTKVEPPGGDLWRSVSPRHGGTSARFYSMNRGKRSVVLDLKQPQGLAVARELVARSDVVVENWRPGVARRLGLDWDELRAEHPALVTMALSGYGETGPRAADRVYDPVLQGACGMAHSQGEGGRPQLTTSVLMDKVAAMAAVQAVLAALFERQRTGSGRHLSVKMLDVAVAFSWPDVLGAFTFADAAPATEELARPPRTSTVAQAGDGRYLTFNAITEADWRGLCEVADRPDLFEEYRSLSTRARATATWVAELERSYARFKRDDLLERLRVLQVPCGPVHAYGEVLEDPQVVHNQIVQEVERPGLGLVREAAPMVRFGEPFEDWVGPAPALGQHTWEVLAELGYARQDIAALAAAGIVNEEASR